MEHEAVSVSTLILPAVNLGILVSLLTWKLKQPIKDFVSNRHGFVRDEVSRVAEQLRQAQDQFAEFTAKLKAIDAEVRAIRDAAKQDAESMKVRLLTEAKRISTTIIADSQVSSQGLYTDLRAQLRMELGQKVLDRAEEMLRSRLTTDDRARIRRDFSKQVEQIQ